MTHSRPSDPDTSYEAGMAAALGASKIRPILVELITEHGPLTHDRLFAEYQQLSIMQTDTPRSSQSGLRTRVSELVRAGLVRMSEEEGVSQYGNRSKQWEVIDPAEYRTIELDSTFRTLTFSPIHQARVLTSKWMRPIFGLACGSPSHHQARVSVG